MKNQGKGILSIAKVLKKEKEIFLKKIQDDLKELIFDSTYIIAPAQFFSYVREEFESIVSFLETENTEIPMLAGKRAFSKGLTIMIICSLIFKIDNFIFNVMTIDKTDMISLTRLTSEYLRHHTLVFDKEKENEIDTSYAQLYMILNNIMVAQRQIIIRLQKKKNRTTPEIFN